MNADIHPPGATTDAAPAAEALSPDVIPSAGEELIAALAVNPAEQPVILDFDETLWLRNSTELFLDTVRPRLAAAIVLQILGFLKPWRLFQSGEPNHHRDWIRVLAVLIVCPWSLWRWRRKAVTLGPALLNRPLWEAVSRRSRSAVGVVTFGFREIIRPLLQAIDPKLPLIESCSLRQGARLRRVGKAAALAGTRGETWLRRSLVVTDSKVDDDLLAASDTAFLVQWPDAEYEQAGMRPLLPFVYLQRVKRPDENYLRNAILGHDLPVLLLAFAVISTAPASTAIALLIFVFGFFAAYETGYHENDRLGLKLEEKPKISANYAKLAHHFRPSVAWGSAILISALAALIAAGESSWIPGKFGLTGGTAVAAVLGAFVLFMIGMRLLFRWQNVIAPQGRIVPMLGLQVGRVLGYAVVFPTSLVGALFCIAHGLSKWIPYVVYRFAGERRHVPNHLNCLLIFGLCALGLAVAGQGNALWNVQGLLIIGYLGARASRDIWRMRADLLPLPGRSSSS